MTFPRLISDNTPELLEEDGRIGKTRTVKHDMEFFNLLKEKTLNDFNRILEAEDINKKINALADLRSDIDEYIYALRDKEYFIDGMIKERQKKMGGFEERLVLEGVDKKILPRWTEEDLEMIEKSGEEDGYPGVNLKRNEENRVFIKSASGKDAWEKQLKSRLENTENSQNNFMEFVEAVRRKDYDDPGK